MNVLVACEFSGIVRDAFAKKGHNAYSCDLLDTETPGKHFKGDVLNFLDMDWDLMIAHPPCTYLARSGQRWHKDDKFNKGAALEFVHLLMNARIPKIAIENPIGLISTWIRKPDQIIEPWWFGHPETKATCLWLKNLPKLQPTNITHERNERMSNLGKKDRSKIRSRTYPGIAEAMAVQWG